MLLQYLSFRPHIGDYFFIVVSEEDVRKGLTEEFPSPYWGLFFYHSRMKIINNAELEVQFPSPYWGLFFYLIKADNTYAIVFPNEFPSPYWGLFFYRGKTRYFGTTWLYLFPSPYWGLFFYHGTDWIN